METRKKEILINQKPKDLLKDFLQNYSNYQSIDVEKSCKLIKETIAYYNGKSSVRDSLVHLQSMENQWYYKLKQNKIDYSVYNHDYYFTDLWACWIIYSRIYLKSLIKKNSLSENKSVFSVLTNIESIVDLGCGVGYTTASLKQIFSAAKVYGTNLENTKQFEFCKFMSDEYDFNLISDVSKIHHNVDLVFASEYFEHILNPLQHLQQVINKINPRFFVIANAFNTRSIGHFIEYKHLGQNINQKDISKMFNNLLIENGYKKLKTKIWNNRPTVWVKNN